MKKSIKTDLVFDTEYTKDIGNFLLYQLKSLLPKRMKECGCEKEFPFYHGKDCTFYADGWNSYRAKVLKIINKLIK